MNDDSLISPRDWRAVGSLHGRAVRSALMNPLRIILVFVLGCGLVVLVVVDFSVMLEVFPHMLGDGKGVASQLNAWTLSLSGLVAIIAFHVVSYAHPSPWFGKALAKAARIILILFMAGTGLLLAGIIYVNGAGSLTSISISEVNTFLDSAMEAVTPEIKELFQSLALPIFPVVFAIGLGGIFVLSIFASHSLIGGIHHLLSRIVEDRRKVRRSAELLAELRQSDAAYRQASRDLAAHEAVPDDELRRRALEVITAAVRDAIRPYEKLLVARKLMAGRDKPVLAGDVFLMRYGLIPVLLELSVEELERRLQPMRSFTADAAAPARKKPSRKE